MAVSIFWPLSLPLPEAPPRGGRLQREQRRQRERSRSPVRRCVSVEGDLHDWAKGKIGANTVWARANRMQTDGFFHPAVQRIYALGRREDDQNIHKRLASLLLELLGFRHLIHHVPGSSITEVVLPSSLFGWLCKNNPQIFLRCMGAGANLVDFWESYLSSEPGREQHRLHKHLRGETAESRRYTVPLHIHEDAGPYAKGRRPSNRFPNSI